MSKAN